MYQYPLLEVVTSVTNYPEDFETVYNLMFDADITISWRAIWACEKISELQPGWFDEQKKEEIIDALLISKHDGSKRLLLSILYNLPLPKEYSVRFLDYCLDHCLDRKESIGVQALCIKMAYRLCRVEPELLSELKAILENAELDYYSAGVKSCIRNTLKKLN